MLDEKKLEGMLKDMYELSGPCIVCRKRKKVLKYPKHEEMGPFCSTKCRQKAVQALKQEHYGE